MRADNTQRQEQQALFWSPYCLHVRATVWDRVARSQGSALLIGVGTQVSGALIGRWASVLRATPASTPDWNWTAGGLAEWDDDRDADVAGDDGHRLWPRGGSGPHRHKFISVRGDPGWFHLSLPDFYVTDDVSAIRPDTLRRRLAPLDLAVISGGEWEP